MRGIYLHRSPRGAIAVAVVVFMGVVGAACGTEDLRSRAESAGGAEDESPALEEVPSPTAAPAPEEVALTPKDRRYLRRLHRQDASLSMPDEEAIAAGRRLCKALNKATRRKGSVTVNLAPSFTEFDVEGERVDFSVFIAAIRVYCPAFNNLVNEYPSQ